MKQTKLDLKSVPKKPPIAPVLSNQGKDSAEPMQQIQLSPSSVYDPKEEKKDLSYSFLSQEPLVSSSGVPPSPDIGVNPRMKLFTTDLNETLSDTRMLVNEVVHSSAPPKVHDQKPKTIPSTPQEYIYNNGSGKEEDINWEHVEKLVRYLPIDDIQLEIFGKNYFDQYRALKKAYDTKIQELKPEYLNITLSTGKFKSILISLPILKRKFIENRELVIKTFDKYKEKLEKYNNKIANNPDAVKKKKQAAKMIALPKRKFVGALLSKITPSQYREALQEIDKQGLQKYSALTPARMLKDLERRAYMTSNNDAVEKLLADRESQKADAFSKGMKNRIKDIEEKLEEKRTDAEKNMLAEYNTTLTSDAKTVSDVRAMLMQGKTPDQIAQALRGIEQYALDIARIFLQKNARRIIQRPSILFAQQEEVL